MRRFTVFAGLLALSSCQSPHPPPAEEAPAPETAPMSDEDQIRARLEEFEQAFNGGDVKTLSSIFTAEGDLIDPAGNMTHGRTALEERWTKMFSGASERPRTDIQATSIRFLRPEIAIADGTSEVFGERSAEGRTEVRGAPGRYTAVWVRQNDQWMLHCLRTMIPVS